MRKLREVLRLRFELKLGYQQIGRSCAIGVSTVHKYLKRAEAAGVTACSVARTYSLTVNVHAPALVRLHSSAQRNPHARCAFRTSHFLHLQTLFPIQAVDPLRIYLPPLTP